MEELKSDSNVPITGWITKNVLYKETFIKRVLRRIKYITRGLIIWKN